MAGSFTPTGTYSNLTRLELEQLRRADFFAGGKALTIGDSALPPEGVVGKGDVNAEPFLTNPTIVLDQVFPITPPQQPGPGLATVSQVANVPSETVRWFGPTFQVDGNQGAATSTTVWTDVSGVNFTLFCLPGDILLIKPKLSPVDFNSNCVGTVNVVGPTTLTLININNPTNAPTTHLSTASAGADKFEYVVVRPNAVQLFAMPGSGATGFEQTFLMVKPGSTLHNLTAPTINQINADRIKNIIPAQYALNTTVDRADAVFDTPGPRQSLDLLGYRIILYPDNGLGTGPNLASPITAVDPVISTSIPIDDQRMTFDFDAGIVRMSCEPSIGGQIKVAGGVNPTTGRLNLYAVFWAVDLTLTIGSARGLYGLRSTNQNGLTPGRVTFDLTNNAWRLGSSNSSNAAFIRAPDLSENPTGKTEFGAFDAGFPRSFIYRAGQNVWTFIRNPPASTVDDPSFQEMIVADATKATVGDGSNPPILPGQYVQTTASTTPGMRDPSVGILAGLEALYHQGFGELHLKRGQYWLQKLTAPIVIPPGIIIEGEGDTTVVKGYSNSTFKLGPNTPWGVYDPDYDQVNGYTGSPTTTFTFPNLEQLEGIDIVWNPTRRVWGVCHVDATLNAVFFNEVRTDGTTVLPGLGIQIKDSGQQIFNGGGATAQHITYGAIHTRGHTPRLAYAPSTDEYVVCWVEGVGAPQIPFVYLQVVHATALYPAVTLATKFTNAQQIVASTVAYSSSSDQPSVAIDPQPKSSFGVAHFCVAFAAGGLGGAVTAQIWDTGSGNLGTSYGFQDYPLTFAKSYVSSVDVSADDNSNFLVAWSEHDHPIVCGNTGVINGSSQLSDTNALSPWNNTNLGLNGNEKVFFLGGGNQALGNFGVEGFIADSPIPNSGTNLTVYQINNGQTQGSPGLPYAADATGNLQWALIGGSTIHGAFIPQVSLATWTFTQGTTFYSGTFTTTGTTTVNTATNQIGFVFPGHRIIFASEPSTVYTVVRVAASTITLTTATVSSVATTASRVGAQFDYTLTSPGFAGSPGGITTTPRELDYVRLSYGSGQWILVCQAFNTTGLLSIQCLPNFDGSKNASFPETAANLTTFVPNQIPVGSPAVYRHHISTCSFLIGPAGRITDKIIPAPWGPAVLAGGANYSLNQADAYYTSAARHDQFNSGLSLGSRGPSTSFPNMQEWVVFGGGGSLHSTNKVFSPYGNAALFSARNYFLTWGAANTATSVFLQSAAPSFIPDVTWSGSDWTVVSPTKNRIQSDTGTYFTNAGQFYLTDATFYFGEGAVNLIDGLYLRQTLIFSGGILYIPSATPGNQYQPVTVIDEHTVRFNLGAVPGLVATTKNLNWYLVNSVPLGVPGYGGAKNPGFRVSPDGKVIISSTYTTYADELSEAQTQSNNNFTPQDDTIRARIFNTNLSGTFNVSASATVPTTVSQVGIVIPGLSQIVFAAQFNTPYSVASVTAAHVVLTTTYTGTPTGATTAFLEPVAAGTGCVGDYGTDCNPTVQGLAPWYNTSRVTYDVGFRGVGVGAPKGFNELNALNGFEPVMCAIAWGENFYGFLDRELSGTQPAYTNRTVFFRQSFGPFRNGLRNMRIEQAELPVANQMLTIKSRYPVVTRHGHPASSTATFTTDGFRNFFITPTVRGMAVPSSGISNNSYDLGLQMIVTDALGNNPIRTDCFDVIGFWNSGANGLQMMYMEDLKSNASPQQPGKVSPVNAGKSCVIWNGAKPVAFSVVSGPLNLSYGGPPYGGFRHIYILMSQFPGDEDNQRVPGFEMLATPLFSGEDLFPGEIARVSSGCGNIAVPVVPPSIYNEPTTQIAAAFSGKTYAVLWAAGLNTGTDNNLGYNQLGITLFTGTQQAGPSSNVTAGGSAATYALRKFFVNSQGRPVLSNPNIVWDGHQFVCTWVVDENPGTPSERWIETVSMPEFGFATPHQIKATATGQVAFNGNGQGLIGNFVPTNGSYTQRLQLDPAINPQPGDIIVVTRTNPAASAEGSYQVIDVEYDFGANQYYAYLINSSNTNVSSFDIFASGSPAVYGMVLSGGVSYGPRLDQQFPQSISPIGNNQVIDATLLSSISSAGYSKNSGWNDSTQASDVNKITGMVYDEKGDAYTLLFHACATSPSGGDPTRFFLTQFRKGQIELTPETYVAQTVNGIHNPISALGWNGRHYLVIYSDETTIGFTTWDGSLKYVLLSDKFQIIESGILDYGITQFPATSASATTPAISFAPGCLPGPLYQNFINLPVRPRNVHIVWNPRLNRWIVSAGYLWIPDSSSSGLSNDLDYFPLVGWGNVSSYSGNTLNTTATGNAQPGMRIGWIDAPGNLRAIMTILEGSSGGTSWTVDVNSTETAATSFITSNTYTAHLIPREDIFCWTLGYSSPAVLVQDADETSIENVTFAGGQDIEEKYLHMATPTWQGASTPQASLAEFTIRHGTYFNHLFLTPTLKVETLRLTNVRSRARVKYGWSMIHGAPTMDRYLFNTANRRS